MKCSIEAERGRWLKPAGGTGRVQQKYRRRGQAQRGHSMTKGACQLASPPFSLLVSMAPQPDSCASLRAPQPRRCRELRARQYIRGCHGFWLCSAAASPAARPEVPGCALGDEGWPARRPCHQSQGYSCEDH